MIPTSTARVLSILLPRFTAPENTAKSSRRLSQSAWSVKCPSPLEQSEGLILEDARLR